MDEKKMEFTANDLKNVLWETLQGLRNKTVKPGDATAVATQAREIIRVMNTQVSVMKLANIRPDEEMLRQCSLEPTEQMRSLRVIDAVQG